MSGTVWEKGVRYLFRTTISTNTYNALGQRVRDQGDGVVNTVTVDEAYGAGGNLLWRYTGSPYNRNQRAFVPLNGAILAEYFGGEPGGTIFDHPGQPQSLSTASDYTGGNFEEHLYYPFGEFWTGEDAHAFSMHPTFDQMPDYDSETDQYNTLNRHYTPMGRWMSPDPFTLSPLHIINPQRWNMYAYSLSNPTTLFDPTGLSAIAVNFQTQVPVGGHEGIISIHDDGRAEYARFGPVVPGAPSGPGKVSAYPLESVPMGSNGLPTDAGYALLTQQVAKIENQDPSTVRMNFFITSESDTNMLDAWIQRNKEAADKGYRPWYSGRTQNCATFCAIGLIQGNAIRNKNLSNVPNLLFYLLSSISTENESQGNRTPKEVVTSKIVPCGGPGQVPCPQ